MADLLAGRYGPNDSGWLFNGTPSDSTDLIHVTRQIAIANTGTLKITDPDGVTDTYTISVAGIYSIRIKRLWVTGTTASGFTYIR